MTRVRQERRAGLLTRSTGEIVVLGMAITVLGLLIIATLAVVISGFVFPDRENAQVVVFLSDTFNTLIGVIAGFLAGRTETALQEKE